MAGDMSETELGDQVRIIRTLLVKPEKPMIRHSMFMSGIDHKLANAYPMRTILFYKTHRDSTEAMEALRCGLATALVAFYPLAGRLVKEGYRAVLDCNDEGVELLEAHCHIPFAELECENFNIQPLFRQLAPMETYDSSVILDAPLVSFQVTTFVGGLTVGIAISHAVADGHAMWMFVRSVAEACRGQPITTIPLHARILLKGKVFTMGTSFPYNPLTELPTQSGAAANYTVQASTLPSELLEYKTIHFSPEMLEALKKACTSSSDHSAGAETNRKSGSFVSTYQALAAYLWKRLVMAQGLHDETCMDLWVSMDVRMRMIPPLTPAYFGNAIVLIPTPVSARELVGERLGATAARIWQSIQKEDDEYIKKEMIAHEGVDLRRNIDTFERTMTIRNGTGFPVYEGGNFGWGEPEAVRPPSGLREGEFTWYPGKKPKSIDAIAPLTRSTYANFFSPHLYPNDPLALSAFPYSHVP